MVFGKLSTEQTIGMEPVTSSVSYTVFCLVTCNIYCCAMHFCAYRLRKSLVPGPYLVMLLSTKFCFENVIFPATEQEKSGLPVTVV